MSTRDDILKGAGDAINGPRRESYGDAQDSFQRVADLWTAAMSNKADGEYVVRFTAGDVALMLALLKIGRLANSRDHFDSWLDLAGYAALGAEVAGAEQKVGTDGRPVSERSFPLPGVDLTLDDNDPARCPVVRAMGDRTVQCAVRRDEDGVRALPTTPAAYRPHNGDHVFLR